ncbi:hypothetical protein SB30_230186 [Klebsiella quasipneumoniae subsp. similipneumoniae]|nr:hypothetical protein SB30_230186 [Klebsiella quasipneumoniae subsp. similipneumoniae]
MNKLNHPARPNINWPYAEQLARGTPHRLGGGHAAAATARRSAQCPRRAEGEVPDGERTENGGVCHHAVA